MQQRGSFAIRNSCSYSYNLFASTDSKAQKALNAFPLFRSNVVTVALIKRALFCCKIQCRLVQRGEYLLKSGHILPHLSNTIFPDSKLPFQNYFQAFLVLTKLLSKAPLEQVYLSLPGSKYRLIPNMLDGKFVGCQGSSAGGGCEMCGVSGLYSWGGLGQLETNRVWIKAGCSISYKALSCWMFSFLYLFVYANYIISMEYNVIVCPNIKHITGFGLHNLLYLMHLDGKMWYISPVFSAKMLVTDDRESYIFWFSKLWREMCGLYSSGGPGQDVTLCKAILNLQHLPHNKSIRHFTTLWGRS